MTAGGYSRFLAEALITNILQSVGRATLLNNDHLTDANRRAIAGLLVNQGKPRFLTSKRQIVLTFDLPGDEESEPPPAPAVEPAPDPEPEPQLGPPAEPEPGPDLSFKRGNAGTA